MQAVNVDPITGLAIGVAIAIVISLFNTYILWKKGAVGRDDIIMMLKIVAALIPQISNPLVQQVVNEVIHAISERLGLPGKHKDVDDLLAKIEQMSKRQVQFGVQSPKPQEA